jgi:hypothetical protein
MQPRVMTDVLRRVPGMQIVPISGTLGTTHVAALGRSTGIGGSGVCPVIYFVNGSPLPMHRDLGINSFVHPEEVVGLEVYSGASTIPPQFSVRDSRCGVVAIWTRIGRDGRTGGS